MNTKFVTKLSLAVLLTKTIDKETNVNTVKVTFTRRKSLVPCVI